MAIPPDLPAEQAHIDRAYARLEVMRRAAEHLRDSVLQAGRGGTHQARVERDVFVQTSLQRLEQLELGRASLVFGRIDRDVEAAGLDGGGEGGVERFYIGRLAVSDERQEPLVVDWRAPVAEAFYRATGRSPMGLRRRRHFAMERRRLAAIEDELFRADGEPGDDDQLGLVGPGALLAALQRSRSGQMRDIVATVQREQDEIIRAELPGVLVVQGGPGTGKTAVALHRAAYLLYTHRFPLEQQGVLVVGPNQLFLRYIDQVLPSLGESGVALTTLPGLVAHIRPRGVDGPLGERVKGSSEMAGVLARAVADRQRGLRDDLVVGFGILTLRLSASTTQGIVAAVRRRSGTHNARRRQVESLLVRALHDQYSSAVARGRRARTGAGVEDHEREELDRAEFGAQILRQPAVAVALDRMWPVLAPEELLNDLFGSPALLTLATRRLLTPAERESLSRPRAPTLDAVPWTPADLPLLDEARALLGPLKARRRAALNGQEDDEDMRGYGHIVVDEAQDVSPMGLRMLTRRSISGSITLVGDIGQATIAAAPRGWDEVLRHLPARRPARVVSLSVNYRTPAEVMVVAAEVLAAAAVEGLAPPRSVRAIGRAPEVRHVTDVAALPDEVALAATSELAAVADGNVGIVAPAALLPGIGRALAAAGAPWGEPERTGLSAPITLLDVASAKGLEFDGVVVVEPAAILSAPGGGMRSLFVALTRPTRHLVVVHADALPEPLARGLAKTRAVGEGPDAGPLPAVRPASLAGPASVGRGDTGSVPVADGLPVQGMFPLD